MLIISCITSHRWVYFRVSVSPSLKWALWYLLQRVLVKISFNEKTSENHVCQLYRWQWKWSHSVMSDCDPMDCSLPGSSVHGIFQARVLEWVAIAFCRGSSQPRDRTWVSCFAGRLFTLWAIREALPLAVVAINSEDEGLPWWSGG